MKTVEMQSLAAEHAKELSQLQRQAMESCEQLRMRYEAQAEAARSTNDSFQRDLIAKTAAFDRQLSGLPVNLQCKHFILIFIFTFWLHSLWHRCSTREKRVGVQAARCIAILAGG